MNERAWLAGTHAAEAHFVEIARSYRGANGEGLKAWVALGMTAHPDGAFDAQPYGAKPLTWARLEQLAAPMLLLTGDS